MARIVVVAALAASFLGGSWEARGGSFAEAFKAFVLGPEASANSLASPELPTDGMSARCMRCHDGSDATPIRLKRAGSGPRFGTAHLTSANHPVGMLYRQHASRRPESFVAPVRMDSRIVLEQGRVTCVSCHRVRDRHPTTPSGGLASGVGDRCLADAGYTTGPSQTRLCMSCHAM